MKLLKSVQFIEKAGKPEWAVIPYKDFLRFQELAQITKEIKSFQKKVASGEEELLPSDYAERLVFGESAIKVWREFRGFTQAQLADNAAISVPYLSQIENSDRQPSLTVLKNLAAVLNVALDDLI